MEGHPGPVSMSHARRSALMPLYARASNSRNRTLGGEQKKTTHEESKTKPRHSNSNVWMPVAESKDVVVKGWLSRP